MKLTKMQAYKIALNYRNDITTGRETKYAFIFGNEKDDENIGVREPVVIMKEDGSVVGMTHYVFNSPDDDDTIEEFTL